MTESNTVDSFQSAQESVHSEREGDAERFADDGGFEPSSTSTDTAISSATTAIDDSDLDAEETIEMLGKLPAEFGMLLILSGIAGVLLPGPVGMPLLIAGGVTMWPKTFDPIERWFSRKFPFIHREGVFQIKEFISDLQRRFPDTK